MTSIPRRRRKPVFVNRVSRFANHAMELPGFPALPVCAVAATGLAITAGAFGTGAMSLALRTQFWIALIGFNAILWQAWFAYTVRHNQGWLRSALLGSVVLNALLPLEVAVCLRLVGVRSRPDIIGDWLKALAITAAILLVVLVLRGSRQAAPAGEQRVQPGGLLARAGATSPADVVSIGSEDHYCRVSLSDGRAPLIHHRFSDALREVACYDGLQVHRSHWVANSGVVGATRTGRRWTLVLANGAKVPVSAGRVPAARLRGWLARP